MLSSDAFSYVNLLDMTADASYQRQTLIMNNIANGDTPGYKRQELEFSSVLRRELIATHKDTLDKAVDALDDDGNHVDGIEFTDYEHYSYLLHNIL